jgi:sugar phosphate isomerase/epimerase
VRWSQSDSVVAAADELNAIAAIAADAGITVGYHNHWWELESRLDGTSALEAFADNLDPAVVLEVDTYWAEVGGVPAVGLLERLGDRVRFIHVKDGDVSPVNENQVAVGSGRMPVREILAAAPQALRVVELDDYDGDVFDALAESVAFLTANGERL